MNLIQFKSADDAVRLTIRLSVGYCVLLTLAFVSCLIYLCVQIEKTQSQALVIDRQGEVYTASNVPSLAMRKNEYMNHVKSFVNSWYAFDENTYEKHVKYALNLIGNKGKELLNEYNDVNMQNSLIQKNIRYDVSIKDIQIDTQTIPTTGKISFTQTGYRARGSISREIVAEFTIYDVSRSEDNAHGAKIEDWIVHYSAPVEQGGYADDETLTESVVAEFTIYDVSRSEDNAHGAKIEDWIVHYSAPVEQGGYADDETLTESVTPKTTDHESE